MESYEPVMAQQGMIKLETISFWIYTILQDFPIWAMVGCFRKIYLTQNYPGK